MVLNLAGLRERLDTVRAARLQHAVDLNERVQELEETLDALVGAHNQAAHPAIDDGTEPALKPDDAYWIQYEL